MEGDLFSKSCSKLLELAAEDDINGFQAEVEEKGCDANGLSIWYGKIIGSKIMGFQERTPLLIAAINGSMKVLKYIIETAKFDVNRGYGLDGVTALHCAVSGGSESAVEIVELLIEEGGADINCVDANGNKPSAIVAPCLKLLLSSLRRKKLEMLLKGVKIDAFNQQQEEEEQQKNPKSQSQNAVDDATLPNVNSGIYATDEFRMYNFKVTPCTRAYTHVWIECPFVHPGENARRRDPSKYNYSCVPCPEFKRGICSKMDSCEYAHGVFESLLHPAQYRTRRCKDDTGCLRKVCFFAHKAEELRPLYVSTGSAIPSSSPIFSSVSSMDIGSLSPSAMSPALSVMCSSPMATSFWQNNISPPALQLPGSSLKSNNMLGYESIYLQQQNRHQMFDEMPVTGLTNIDDVFGSLDPTLLSPTGIQMLRNTNHHQHHHHPLRNNFSPSSRNYEAFHSRLSPFGNRTKSFLDQASGTDSTTKISSNKSDLGWIFSNDELSKHDESESFGIRNGKGAFEMIPSLEDESDVSWVRSLVKDSDKIGSVLDNIPSWFDNMHIEHEQLVA